MNPMATRKQKRVIRALREGRSIRLNKYGHRVLDGRTVPDAAIDVMIADGLLSSTLSVTAFGSKAVQP